MGKYRFTTNPSVYKKDRSLIPGGIVGKNMNIYPKTERPAEEDSKNRKAVVERINILIKEGKTIEDAVDEIYSNIEIRKQFEYLEKHGIDLKVTFKSWYNGINKNKSRGINFYTAGNAGIKPDEENEK